MAMQPAPETDRHRAGSRALSLNTPALLRQIPALVESPLPLQRQRSPRFGLPDQIASLPAAPWVKARGQWGDSATPSRNCHSLSAD